jgi:ribosomal protein L4
MSGESTPWPTTRQGGKAAGPKPESTHFAGIS